jgi:hypothetical protein
MLAYDDSCCVLAHALPLQAPRCARFAAPDPTPKQPVPDDACFLVFV